MSAHEDYISAFLEDAEGEISELPPLLQSIEEIKAKHSPLEVVSAREATVAEINRLAIQSAVECHS